MMRQNSLIIIIKAPICRRFYNLYEKHIIEFFTVQVCFDTIKVLHF